MYYCKYFASSLPGSDPVNGRLYTGFCPCHTELSGIIIPGIWKISYIILSA